MDDADNEHAGTVAKAVGVRIRALRERSGMSQQDFASRAGMKRQYANRVEAGLQNLSLRLLSRIAVALDTTMSTLLDGIDADPADVGVRPWVRRDTANSPSADGSEQSRDSR